MSNWIWLGVAATVGSFSISFNVSGVSEGINGLDVGSSYSYKGYIDTLLLEKIMLFEFVNYFL